VVLATVRGRAPDLLGVAAYLAALILDVVIGILAIAPHIIRQLGLTVAPVRVEAVLLCMVVFLGVNVAWLFLFDGGAAPDAEPSRPAADASPDAPAGHHPPNLSPGRTR
jgi:hypothetical protein